MVGSHALMGNSSTEKNHGLYTLRSNYCKMVLIKFWQCVRNKAENKRLKQSVLHWDASQSIKYKMYFPVCQHLHELIIIIHVFMSQTHVKDMASNHSLTQSTAVVSGTFFPAWVLLSPIFMSTQQASGELVWGQRDVKVWGTSFPQKNTFFV